MQKIALFTNLNGAERQEVQTWSLSLSIAARNLRKAVKELAEERQYIANVHGDVECGEVWLEIDGIKFDDASYGNLQSYMEAGRVLHVYDRMLSNTV